MLAFFPFFGWYMKVWGGMVSLKRFDTGSFGSFLLFHEKTPRIKESYSDRDGSSDLRRDICFVARQMCVMKLDEAFGITYPPRMPVTTRIIPFLIGNPELNLHL